MYVFVHVCVHVHMSACVYWKLNIFFLINPYILEKLQLYDVLHFDVTGGDLHTVMLIDAGNQMHVLKMPPCFSNQNETWEQTWSHSDIWKDMLKYTKVSYNENNRGCVSHKIPLYFCKQECKFQNDLLFSCGLVTGPTAQ